MIYQKPYEDPHPFWKALVTSWQDEPTKEDDQLDVSLIGENEFRKNLRNELITNIFFSLISAVIGVVLFFMGNENPGDRIWIGYVLLGFFILLSIALLIVGIIRYRRRLKDSIKINNELSEN